MKSGMSALRSSLTAVLKQLFLILLAMLTCSVFLLLLGYDPFIVLRAIIKAVRSDLGGTIRWAAGPSLRLTPRSISRRTCGSRGSAGSAIPART